MPYKRIECAPFVAKLANGKAVCSRLIRGVRAAQLTVVSWISKEGCYASFSSLRSFD